MAEMSNEYKAAVRALPSCNVRLKGEPLYKGSDGGDAFVALCRAVAEGCKIVGLDANLQDPDNKEVAG